MPIVHLRSYISIIHLKATERPCQNHWQDLMQLGQCISLILLHSINLILVSSCQRQFSCTWKVGGSWTLLLPKRGVLRPRLRWWTWVGPVGEVFFLIWQYVCYILEAGHETQAKAEVRLYRYIATKLEHVFGWLNNIICRARLCHSLEQNQIHSWCHASERRNGVHLTRNFLMNEDKRARSSYQPEVDRHANFFSRGTALLPSVDTDINRRFPVYW